MNQAILWTTLLKTFLGEKLIAKTDEKIWSSCLRRGQTSENVRSWVWEVKLNVFSVVVVVTFPPHSSSPGLGSPLITLVFFIWLMGRGHETREKHERKTHSLSDSWMDSALARTQPPPTLLLRLQYLSSSSYVSYWIIFSSWSVSSWKIFQNFQAAKTVYFKTY